jgi:opacity protein-like surface antigen
MRELEAVEFSTKALREWVRKKRLTDSGSGRSPEHTQYRRDSNGQFANPDFFAIIFAQLMPRSEMRKPLIWLFLVLVSSIPTALLGQDKFGFELGVYGGRSFWKDRDFQIGLPQASPPISLQYQYDDRFFGGARANLLSRGHWGGEISYSYQKNTLTFARETPAQTLALKGSIQQVFYNEVFYLLRYDKAPVLPFVTAGIGFAAFGLSDQARAYAADPAGGGIGALTSYDTKFAFNYGAGVKAKIGSRFGVRFDVRHVLSDVARFGLPKDSADPAQTVLPLGGRLQNYEASAGFYFSISSKLGN